MYTHIISFLYMLVTMLSMLCMFSMFSMFWVCTPLRSPHRRSQGRYASGPAPPTGYSGVCVFMMVCVYDGVCGVWCIRVYKGVNSV
jgi:hypothetical protein